MRTLLGHRFRDSDVVTVTYMWAPRPLSPIQNSPIPILTRRPRRRSKLPTVGGTRRPSSHHRRRHWAWRPPPHHLLPHRRTPDALHLPTAGGTGLGAPPPHHLLPHRRAPDAPAKLASSPPSSAGGSTRLLPTLILLGASPDPNRPASSSPDPNRHSPDPNLPTPSSSPNRREGHSCRPHPCPPTDPRSDSLSGRASSPAPQQAWRSVFTVEERCSRPRGLFRRGPPLRLRRAAPRPVVTPRILQLNFFFFSLLAKIRALPFPFLFPSLNLDLFQSSSGIRFGIPV
jgi:hypothetical protein